MRSPSAPLLDTFDRANGGAGTNYAIVWNGDVVPNVLSNQAVCATDGFGTGAYWKTLYGADQEVSALVTKGAADIHLWARCDPATMGSDNPTYYDFEAVGTFSGGTGVELHKWVAGVDTTLLADTGVTGFDAMLLQCVGRVITGSVRDSTTGIWRVALQIENTSIPGAAGGSYIAIGIVESGTTGKVDDLRGGAITVVENFLSNAGALAAGYTRTQGNQVSQMQVAYWSDYTIPLAPTSGVKHPLVIRGVGTSQTLADTNALIALNAWRINRYAGGPAAAIGSPVIAGHTLDVT